MTAPGTAVQPARTRVGRAASWAPLAIALAGGLASVAVALPIDDPTGEYGGQVSRYFRTLVVASIPIAGLAGFVSHRWFGATTLTLGVLTVGLVTSTWWGVSNGLDLRAGADRGDLIFVFLVTALPLLWPFGWVAYFVGLWANLGFRPHRARRGGDPVGPDESAP